MTSGKRENHLLSFINHVIYQYKSTHTHTIHTITQKFEEKHLFAYIQCLKRTVSCVCIWALDYWIYIYRTISCVFCALCTAVTFDEPLNSRRQMTKRQKCHTNKSYEMNWKRKTKKIFIKPKVMCVRCDIIANWMELVSLTGCSRITLFRLLTVRYSENHSKIANKIYIYVYIYSEHSAFFKDWNGQK